MIACNTASALALDEIRQTAEPHGIPVVGVIGPGAAAAAAETATRDALVIATSATVQSHAYAAACQSLGLRSLEKACPLLVPLVEEGWIDHPVTAEVVGIYLSELHQQAAEAGLRPDTIVLGCTHYPLLREVIEAAVAKLWPGQPPRIIDSAEATAREVGRQLATSAAVENTSAGRCVAAGQLLRHRLGDKISPTRHSLPRPTDWRGQTRRPRRLICCSFVHRCEAAEAANSDARC